ncbi:MAG TPA: response regulator [Cellulomonas sp.]|uniref:response regulator n=1 Tax=Cellulomonas sp. TaxID=40001 RepID=UPI002E367522|nr:response regulator [Cellulomonas sp.]HEX5332875.1 response regulator [Cellulomonas sp.]
MIRTVIVDDDFMAVSVHRQFTERVPGFEIVGTASTGASALALVAELRPDLVLLDMYLPDINGVEVLRRLRATTGLEVDVIAITSAKDVDVLRGAMHLGVAHYLVKPFTFEIFRERLESYAVARQRLEHMAEADQRSVDRVYGTLRSAGADSLPKNISAPTLALVMQVLREKAIGTSAGDVARRAEISPGVARRYLRYLTDTGTIDYTLRYGAAGRPEHLYRWVGPSAGVARRPRAAH